MPAGNEVQMIETKNYNLMIDPEEVLRYLGYGQNEPDPAVAVQLEEAVRAAERIAKPAAVYRSFPVRNTSGGILLEGTNLLLPGSTARTMLQECSRCILLAATVGSAIDLEIRRRQIRDMTGALIFDSAAGCAVEALCEQLTGELEQEYQSKGQYLTDRFSPGYGDLPLSLQPDIIRTLAAERTIGLSVTSGLLLMPVKSVTAFIGVSDLQQPRRITGCAHCSMNTTCKFRKAGTTCASQFK